MIFTQTHIKFYAAGSEISRFIASSVFINFPFLGEDKIFDIKFCIQNQSIRERNDNFIAAKSNFMLHEPKMPYLWPYHFPSISIVLNADKILYIIFRIKNHYEYVKYLISSHFVKTNITWKYGSKVTKECNFAQKSMVRKKNNRPLINFFNLCCIIIDLGLLLSERKYHCIAKHQFFYQCTQKFQVYRLISLHQFFYCLKADKIFDRNFYDKN